jgi:ribonuclease HI
MKDQVVADFIVGHSIDQNINESCNLVSIHPWKFFFDGSTCREGQGLGVALILNRGVVFETSTHLEYFCTNNQAEYEVILLGLQFLSSMGIKHVEAFGDSLLVVQQVPGMYQCFDRSLNAYLDKYLEIVVLLMILLCNMFPGMKIQSRMIWHSKHQVSNQIEENLEFWKNRMFRFAKPNILIFNRCIVQQSILLNQI